MNAEKKQTYERCINDLRRLLKGLNDLSNEAYDIYSDTDPGSEDFGRKRLEARLTQAAVRDVRSAMISLKTLKQHLF